MARIPATAANESCQPGSAHARGFSASVAAAASSRAYAREAGRDAAIATMPAIPITPARCSDGPGAGERHVERDQGHERGEPRPRAEAGQHQRRQGERRQQHHVLAADRQQVGEPAVAEVVARAVSIASS